MPAPKSNEYEGLPKSFGSARFEETYRIAEVRQEGRDHALKRQKPCQDSAGFGRSGPFIWLVVADGVGSETHSQFGSRLACDSVGEFLHAFNMGTLATDTAIVETDLGYHAIHAARWRLEAYAKAHDLELRKLSSTLQIVIMNLETDMAFYAAIGDGNCIAVVDGRARIIGHNRKAPRLGTPNLGSPDFEAFIHDEIIAPVCAVESVLLFTDGLDRLFVVPRVDDPAEAVGVASVENIRMRVATAKGEFQALNRLGDLLTADKYEEDYRDDLSLIVFENLGLVAQPAPDPEPASKPEDVQAGKDGVVYMGPQDHVQGPSEPQDAVGADDPTNTEPPQKGPVPPSPQQGVPTGGREPCVPKPRNLNAQDETGKRPKRPETAPRKQAAWSPRDLMIGGVVGIALGLGGAQLLSPGAEAESATTQTAPSEASVEETAPQNGAVPEGTVLEEGEQNTGEVAVAPTEQQEETGESAAPSTAISAEDADSLRETVEDRHTADAEPDAPAIPGSEAPLESAPAGEPGAANTTTTSDSDTDGAVDGSQEGDTANPPIDVGGATDTEPEPAQSE